MRREEGFRGRVHQPDPDDGSAELNALIVREAGEELAQFFLSYSASLISARSREGPREHLEPHAHGLSHPRRRGARTSIATSRRSRSPEAGSLPQLLKLPRAVLSTHGPATRGRHAHRSARPQPSLPRLHRSRPATSLRRAKQAGLDGVAFTDLNTLEGLEEIRAAGPRGGYPRAVRRRARDRPRPLPVLFPRPGQGPRAAAGVRLGDAVAGAGGAREGARARRRRGGGAPVRQDHRPAERRLHLHARRARRDRGAERARSQAPRTTSPSRRPTT